MRFLVLTILSTVIFWFVWNFMQRTFGPKSSPPRQPKPSDPNRESKIQWDAETVEFEEIKKPEEKK